MVRVAALAPVAVNNVLKGARYIALLGGIGYGMHMRRKELPVAKANLAKAKAKEEEAAKALEAKKAAEALEPSILV